MNYEFVLKHAPKLAVKQNNTAPGGFVTEPTVNAGLATPENLYSRETEMPLNYIQEAGSAREFYLPQGQTAVTEAQLRGTMPAGGAIRETPGPNSDPTGAGLEPPAQNLLTPPAMDQRGLPPLTDLRGNPEILPPVGQYPGRATVPPDPQAQPSEPRLNLEDPNGVYEHSRDVYNRARDRYAETHPPAPQLAPPELRGNPEILPPMGSYPGRATVPPPTGIPSDIRTPNSPNTGGYSGAILDNIIESDRQGQGQQLQQNADSLGSFLSRLFGSFRLPVISNQAITGQMHEDRVPVEEPRGPPSYTIEDGNVSPEQFDPTNEGFRQYVRASETERRRVETERRRKEAIKRTGAPPRLHPY